LTVNLPNWRAVCAAARAADAVRLDNSMAQLFGNSSLPMPPPIGMVYRSELLASPFAEFVGVLVRYQPLGKL
jgi:hypothetical protein